MPKEQNEYPYIAVIATSGDPCTSDYYLWRIELAGKGDKSLLIKDGFKSQREANYLAEKWSKLTGYTIRSFVEEITYTTKVIEVKL